MSRMRVSMSFNCVGPYSMIPPLKASLEGTTLDLRPFHEEEVAESGMRARDEASLS